MNIFTALETIHVSLRRNDLKAAEKDLQLLEPVLSNVDPASASGGEAMCYFWYSAILKRKLNQLSEAEHLFKQAQDIAMKRQDVLHLGRIVLDYANLKRDQQSFEESQQMLDIAVQFAERATDWATAAKAAKNRAVLLSVSDKPGLGRPELLRAIEFFKRANDPDGVARTKRMLNYSQSDFVQEMFGLSVSASGSKEDADLAQPPAMKKKNLVEVLIGGLKIKRKFDSNIQKTRQPIQDPERFKRLFQEFGENQVLLQRAASLDARQYAECAEKALKLADEMIEAAPQRAIPWTCRCLALGALGRYSEALVANDQAIAIDPSDPDKWDLRSNIMKALGRKKEADQAIKRAKDLRKS